MLKKGEVNAQTIRNHAIHLPGESHFKAQAERIGDKFRTGGGARRVTDVVDSLLKRL
jgi:hypothetical protein